MFLLREKKILENSLRKFEWNIHEIFEKYSCGCFFSAPIFHVIFIFFLLQTEGICLLQAKCRGVLHYMDHILCTQKSFERATPYCFNIHLNFLPVSNIMNIEKLCRVLFFTCIIECHKKQKKKFQASSTLLSLSSSSSPSSSSTHNNSLHIFYT